MGSGGVLPGRRGGSGLRMGERFGWGNGQRGRLMIVIGIVGTVLPTEGSVTRYVPILYGHIPTMRNNETNQ